MKRILTTLGYTSCEINGDLLKILTKKSRGITTFKNCDYIESHKSDYYVAFCFPNKQVKDSSLASFIFIESWNGVSTINASNIPDAKCNTFSHLEIMRTDQNYDMIELVEKEDYYVLIPELRILNHSFTLCIKVIIGVWGRSVLNFMVNENVDLIAVYFNNTLSEIYTYQYGHAFYYNGLIQETEAEFPELLIDIPITTVNNVNLKALTDKTEIFKIEPKLKELYFAKSCAKSARK